MCFCSSGDDASLFAELRLTYKLDMLELRRQRSRALCAHLPPTLVTEHTRLVKFGRGATRLAACSANSGPLRQDVMRFGGISGMFAEVEAIWTKSRARQKLDLICLVSGRVWPISGQFGRRLALFDEFRAFFGQACWSFQPNLGMVVWGVFDRAWASSPSSGAVRPTLGVLGEFGAIWTKSGDFPAELSCVWPNVAPLRQIPVQIGQMLTLEGRIWGVLGQFRAISVSVWFV